MKIERYGIGEITIEAFADAHDLVMEVHERERPVGDLDRYYAFFKNVEVSKGEGLLIGLYGNGRTPSEAIANYTEAISHERLVIGAWTETRRTIIVPCLKIKIV